MRTFKAPFPLLVPAALTLAGCSGVAPPTIIVTDAAVVERSPDARVVQVRLKAENPNPDPLVLDEVTYDVSLDGGRTFTGLRAPLATIRAFGTQTIALPAPIAADADPTSFTIRGAVVFQPPGVFSRTLYRSRLIRPSAAFEGSGSVAPAP